jgi:hypothetical protein
MNDLIKLKNDLNLDIFKKLDITGPKIWMFYKDICGENYTKMLECIRALEYYSLSDRFVNSIPAPN